MGCCGTCIKYSALVFAVVGILVQLGLVNQAEVIDTLFSKYIPSKVFGKVLDVASALSCTGQDFDVIREQPTLIFVLTAKSGFSVTTKGVTTLAQDHGVCWTMFDVLPRVTKQDVTDVQIGISAIFNRGILCYPMFCDEEYSKQGEVPFRYPEFKDQVGDAPYRVVTIVRNPINVLRSLYAYISTDPEYAFHWDNRHGLAEGGFTGVSEYIQTASIKEGLEFLVFNHSIFGQLGAMVASYEQANFDSNAMSIRFEDLQNDWDQYWTDVFNFWGVLSEEQLKVWVKSLEVHDLSRMPESEREGHAHVTSKKTLQEFNADIMKTIKKHPQIMAKIRDYQKRLGYPVD